MNRNQRLKIGFLGLNGSNVIWYILRFYEYKIGQGAGSWVKSETIVKLEEVEVCFRSTKSRVIEIGFE